MATEVGSAYVTILPSMRGFSRATSTQISRSGIDRTLSSTLSRGAAPAGSRAGGLFSSAFNSRARVGLNARGGIFTGLITTVHGIAPLLLAGGAAASVFALKTADSMDQAKIAFTTMLDSAKRAKLFLLDLTHFAATTPFDLPGVRTSAQQLLAFGFKAKDVIPTLTALGDASAGLGIGAEGLSRITLAIGQIQAKGRVQSDELLQLTEAGIPALKILANQFGTTTGAMQDMVTKGLVPANKAIPALLAGIESGTAGAAGDTAKFAGLMERQSHTLGGTLSNLRDTVTTGLGRAFKPLAHLFASGLPGATGKLSGVFLGLRDALRASIPYLQSFAGFMRDQVFPVLSAVGRFVATKIVPLFVAFYRQILPAVSDAFGDVADAVRENQGGLKTIGKILGGVAKIAVSVFGRVFATSIRITGKFLALLLDELGRVGNRIQTVARLVRGPATRAFQALAGALKVITAQVQRVVDWVKTLVGWLARVKDAAKDAASGLLAFVPGASRAASAVHSLRGSVAGDMEAIGSETLAGGRAAGNNFVSGFLSGLQPLFTFGGPIGRAIIKATGGQRTPPAPQFPTFNIGDLGSIGDTGGLGDVGGKIAKTVAAGTPKVAAALSTLMERILGPLRETLAKARELASSITQAIIGDTGFGAIAARTDSLGAAFGQSVHSIVDALRQQKNAVQAFRGNLRRLRHHGLSKAAARELAGEGLAGAATAATLTDATHRQLREISRLRSGTNQAARGIGRDAAIAKFGHQISRDIQRAARQLEKATHDTDLSNKTIRHMEHAFVRGVRAAKPYVDLKIIDKKNGIKVVTG